MEKRFLIVGLGLLGGRYAMGLARAGFYVEGADIDPAAVAFALEKGYIRQGRCGEHADLASQADVVVDGRFVQALKDPALHWRGSANQRLIDVRKSLEAGRPVLYPD